MVSFQSSSGKNLDSMYYYTQSQFITLILFIYVFFEAVNHQDKLEAFIVPVAVKTKRKIEGSNP